MIEDDASQEECAMTEYLANVDDSLYRHTPTAFHLFTKLPQELQDLVWCFVATEELPKEPRIVIEEDNYTGPISISFAALYEVPAMLQVSSGVRAEGFRLLPHPTVSGFGSKIRRYHFDFRRDIVFETL
jgi:hypothetical protein